MCIISTPTLNYTKLLTVSAKTSTIRGCLAGEADGLDVAFRLVPLPVPLDPPTSVFTLLDLALLFVFLFLVCLDLVFDLAFVFLLVEVVLLLLLGFAISFKRKCW